MSSKYGLLILAGGRASRLKDKPFVKFRGVPMVKYVYDSLKSKNKFSEFAISIKKEHKERMSEIFMGEEVNLICDSVDGYSPILGILSMEQMESDNVFVAPCDAPNSSLALNKILKGFKKEYDASVPKWQNNIEPLIAVYKRKRMISACKITLSMRRFAVVDAYTFIKVNYVDFPDDKPFKNINTIEDLTRLQQDYK